jgi:hypothetical protein
MKTTQDEIAQILAMIDTGTILQIVPSMLVAIGYAEIWPDRDAMFFCELGNGTTGKQHILQYERAKVQSNQVTFYDKAGKIVAGLSPYVENPEVNTDDMNEAWASWKKVLAQGGLECCQQRANEWRHLEFG